MLADRIVNRVEFLLAKSFLHRDIKPDNLLMGLGRCANQVQRRVYSSVNTGRVMNAAEVAENKLFLLHPKLQSKWIAIVGRKNVGYNANTSP
ncbi:hypothetical protein MKW92_022433 [Papaver armeniacum]|nr:hypothetical protein MKW92_022433 [Papaver armeniacum]